MTSAAESLEEARRAARARAAVRAMQTMSLAQVDAIFRLCSGTTKLKVAALSEVEFISLRTLEARREMFQDAAPRDKKRLDLQTGELRDIQDTDTAGKSRVVVQARLNVFDLQSPRETEGSDASEQTTVTPGFKLRLTRGGKTTRTKQELLKGIETRARLITRPPATVMSFDATIVGSNGQVERMGLTLRKESGVRVSGLCSALASVLQVDMAKTEVFPQEVLVTDWDE